MTDEFNRSLCLALPNLSGTNTFYRIADYDLERRQFTQATYENWMEDTPLSINSGPREGISDQVELRKWKPLEYLPNQQYSQKISMRQSYIYEIVFLDELIHQPLSDSEIRQLFYDGVELPKGIKTYFLLIIDAKVGGYSALLCNKKAFKEKDGKHYIEKQVRNMENALISFEKIDIYSDEISSTEQLKHKLDWYEEPVRYFYNSVILPEASGKFLLRNPEDYTVGFFTNYLNHESIRTKYSNQERSNLLAELEFLENEYDRLRNFFDEFEINESNPVERFMGNITSLTEYIKTMSVNDKKILLSILKSNTELEKMYEEEIEDRWMSKFNQNILDKENELKTINEQHAEMSGHLDELQDKIRNSKKEYNVAKEEYEKMTNQKRDIQKQIEEELEEFQLNIVEQYKIAALQSQNLSTVQQNPRGIIHTPPGTMPFMETADITSAEDAVEAIKLNLENFMEDNTEEFSCLSFSVFSHHKALILPEFQSEGIANSLSLPLTGKPVERFDIVDDNYDLSYIINTINDSEGGVFLISGLLDLLSESSLFTLINHCPDVKLIFTINNEKILSMFSANLWNYCVYINMIDSIDPLIGEYHWKYSTSDNKEWLDFETDIPSIPNDFQRRIDSQSLFNKYAREELLSIMDHYDACYKELFNPNFQLTSMEKVPLSHQIIIANYDKLTKLETYFKDIGIDTELLNRYKQG